MPSLAMAVFAEPATALFVGQVWLTLLWPPFERAISRWSGLGPGACLKLLHFAPSWRHYEHAPAVIGATEASFYDRHFPFTGCRRHGAGRVGHIISGRQLVLSPSHTLRIAWKGDGLADIVQQAVDIEAAAIFRFLYDAHIFASTYFPDDLRAPATSSA